MRKKLSGKQKGFTLVELLVVIGIMGILAAIVVPTVTHFIGKGKSEAARTEVQNVQTAMTAMMVDNNTDTVAVSPASGATNDMTTFPTDHPLYPATGTKYIQHATTTNYYKVNLAGEITAFSDSGGLHEIP